MEERIIRTSLNAIKGPHRDKILRLFNAFAIVPEDTRTPIEVVAMLFEAESETPLPKPPSLLNIRRWLKVLIDRSLILGTVDRPSLHDIVMEFVAASKSDEARRGMNRRLVELWRSRRPPGGWDADSKESVPQYISLTAVHHMNGAWEADWSKDEGSIAWLSDFVDGKQDAIPVFAAQALGSERTAELAKEAESADDWWLASLRWAASALSEHRLGGYGKSLPLLQESGRTLEQVDTSKAKNQLEVTVLLMALQSYDPTVAAFGSRIAAIVETDPTSADTFTRISATQFSQVTPAMFAGDRPAYGRAMTKLLTMCLEGLETVHAGDHEQRCQLLGWHSCYAISCPCPPDDWEAFYKSGSVLAEVQTYDYVTMHASMRRLLGGLDLVLCWPGWAIEPLLVRGELDTANKHMDKMLPAAMACAESWDPLDCTELVFFKTIWPYWLYIMGRKDDARALLHSGPLDTLEENIRAIVDMMGAPWLVWEDLLAHASFLEILLADDPPPASALAKLPSPAEAAMLGVTELGHSVTLWVEIITQVPAMLAHERVGSAEGALACAAGILETDIAKGGTESKRLHSLAHACRGRVLAAQGKMEAAEAAFDSAFEVAEAAGLHFLTALTLRDLCKHVLDGAGRGEEGQKRLEEAVSRLACSVEDLDAYVFPR